VNAAARFRELLRGPEEMLALDEAALLLAAKAHPRLDVPAQLGRLDEIAAMVEEPTLDALRDVLFERLGFRGDIDTYESPGNSFLNEVLDRRQGIPITLSVVAMEVGRRADVPLAGVGMPGHFLTRHMRRPSLFLDAFAAGRLMDEDDCAERFSQLFPAGVFDRTYLEPIGPRAIVARMLNNLRARYMELGDQEALGWVTALRATIPDLPAGELAEHAHVLVNLGRFGEAAEAYGDLAGLVRSPDEAERLRAKASLLRARLN
jgi:regulator of sirC expression with transglutaminase-like and TPR domain